MYSSNGREATSRTALLAVLQAFLLLSALVLTPVSVFAQDGDAAPSHAPDATEPVAEPTPAVEPEPAAVAQPEPKQPGPTAKQAESEPKAAPAQVEPERKLRTYPTKIKLFPGGKKVMRAWSCRADIGASFGPDKEPGTADDECFAVRAKWSVQPEDDARLSFAFGYKTRITLLADSNVDVIVKANGLTGKGRVIAKDEPAKVRPQAVTAEPTVVEAPAEPVVVETPTDPVVEETAADDCDVDPLTGECLPAEEPVVEEPVATDAPKADEPKADEPKADPKPKCDIDPLTGECLGDAPVAAPKATPEPTAAPKATKSIMLQDKT